MAKIVVLYVLYSCGLVLLSQCGIIRNRSFPPNVTGKGIRLTGILGGTANESRGLQERQNIGSGTDQGQLLHYYADLTLGNQGRTYSMLVDTGSSDLLIFDVDTSDSSLSADGRSCTVGYGQTGDRQTTGQVYSGPYTITDQPGPIDDYFCFAPPIANGNSRDGVIGLSLPNQPGRRTVSSQTQETTATHWSSFGLYLQQTDGSEAIGQLTVEGADPDYYAGEDYWTYEYILEQPGSSGAQLYLGSWQFSYTSYAVDDQAGSPANPIALVDSGSPYIQLDHAAVGALYSALQAQGAGISDPSSSPQRIDCAFQSQGPALTFTFGSGSQYTVNSQQYITNTPSGACILTVIAVQNDQHTAILGVPFLWTYYAWFDVTDALIGFNPVAG